MGQLLHGKMVGLVGLGRIGRRMVELLTPFGVTFLAREKAPLQNFVDVHSIHLVSLDKLVQSSDAILLHITLDSETRGMIGDCEIRKMKKNAVVINTSRGELLDDTALSLALHEGRIAGAGIDVFSVEPYNGPLLQCENALLTCHMGSYARETRVLMEMEAVNNLIAALRK